MYPSRARKGLGRHVRKYDSEGWFCRGRKVRKKGYRKAPRKIATVFGPLTLPLLTVECLTCGARYCPLLTALPRVPSVRTEIHCEHEVIESVIDTTSRRLIDGRSFDISLGGIHNIVVSSDIDETFQGQVSAKYLSGIAADGTGDGEENSDR